MSSTPDLQSGKKLIRGAFIRMMIVNMFVMAATNVCGFVDNVIVSHVLGTDALAAIGFFSPVSTAVGLFYVIVIGVQVLCGNFIGSGKKDRINSLFFPVNVFNNCLLNSYQAQGRMKLVNVMSVAETSMIGLLVYLTVPHFGINAAWLANTWIDLLCTAVLIASVWIWKKKPDLHAESILKLPEDFGASPEDFREDSVKTMADVTAVSEAVTAFCKARKVDDRRAFVAGLSVEEMTRNVLEHGARREKKGKNAWVDVRVVAQNGLTIRIRDNCPEFDPRKRIDLFDPQSPEQNVGIRMTAKLADQMDYYNSAGVNTLILKM